MILLLSTIAALIWANSPFAASYHQLWTTSLAGFSLHYIVNDGLMTIFFFTIGLEIKRELKSGTLSSPRAAALPIIAAIGGMIVPALIYFLLNPSGPTAHGWGIPMATDIAFAIGVVAVLGKRVPAALRVFLLSLAVIDDIGALLVIAIFYSSGVHATVAGALLAMFMPKAVLKYESALQKFSAIVIMPLFALANAGVSIHGSESGAAGTVALGIILGLVLGKPIGITLFSWLGVRLKLAQLPEGVSWLKLHGISWLGGIGFTVSIFIASLAFGGGGSPLLDTAVLAVLGGSLIASVAGCIILLCI